MIKVLRKEEKREFPRLTKSFSAKFKLFNEVIEKESIMPQYNSQVRNISAGGLLIELDLSKNLPQDLFAILPKRIAIEFITLDTVLNVMGIAEVIWIDRKINKKQRLGLRFIEINEEQKKTINGYVLNQAKKKNNFFANICNPLEDIFYYKIIRPLLFTSRLGRRAMFGYADSGLNFDYIYRTQAKGYTKFGRIIDKILLNLPSAKATRHRKQRIVDILTDEIKRNISNGKKTRIVDLASGPSRYLVEVITKENNDFIEAVCFDLDRRNLEFGRKIAQGKPLLFKRANVLRLRHLKRLSEKIVWIPNIILCSGFYEYLNDAEVKKSLNEIFTSIDRNGFLIFVTQIDNPNRKLIEKLGKTKQNKPWVLIYRKPSILKDWMLDAGFKEILIEIDPWGMYVFCLGRKI